MPQVNTQLHIRLTLISFKKCKRVYFSVTISQCIPDYSVNTCIQLDYGDAPGEYCYCTTDRCNTKTGKSQLEYCFKYTCLAFQVKGKQYNCKTKWYVKP